MSFDNPYPSVSDVAAADAHVLFDWDKNLMQPVTDVERTVLRRIRQRIEKLTRDAAATDPKINGMINEINDQLNSVGLDGLAGEILSKRE